MTKIMGKGNLKPSPHLCNNAGFRRLKAYKQLPILKQALLDHRQNGQLDQVKDAA